MSPERAPMTQIKPRNRQIQATPKENLRVVQAAGPTAQSRAFHFQTRSFRRSAYDCGQIQNREYSWLPKQVKLRANRQCTRAKAARVRCPCIREPQSRIAPLAAMRAFRQARALYATNLLSP